MALNKNELILDKVRSVSVKDLTDNRIMYRLTQVEEPTLNCTAESEEVVDAVGAVITTLYRAKRATFGGSNSLINFDLAAAQYGSEKEVADTNAKIVDSTYEILEVSNNMALAHAPVVDSINYVYVIENNQIGTAYSVGATASATEAVIAADGTVTPPTGVTSGKLYIEYEYETENAFKVVNNASDFPEACSLVVYAYFKDVCNENVIYSGKIIVPKAKLNPESIELSLTSTGKHPFEFIIMKDYCADEGMDKLFEIIVSE